MPEKLRDFVWYDKEQDYDWFGKHLQQASETDQILSEFIEVGRQPYSTADLIASGVFLTEEELENILERLAIQEGNDPAGSAGRGKNVHRAEAGVCPDERDR